MYKVNCPNLNKIAVQRKGSVKMAIHKYKIMNIQNISITTLIERVITAFGGVACMLVAKS